MRVALCVAVVLLVVGPSAAAPASGQTAYANPNWSPDGRQITFVGSGGDGDLFVMNADGTGLRQITHSSYEAGNWNARYPDWSPDGRWIAFGYRSSDIDVIHPEGTGEHTVAQGTDPAWSPRGRKLAFTCCIDEGDRASIYVVGPAGGNQQLVATSHSGTRYLAPTWSPDGRRIAFQVAYDPEDSDIPPTFLGVISGFRARVHRLHTGAFDPWAPDWSPAGGKIVFTDDLSAICVLNLNTYRVRTLFRPGGAAQLYKPKFSPDGQRIVFDWAGGIWVMNADGSNRHELLAPTSG